MGVRPRLLSTNKAKSSESEAGFLGWQLGMGDAPLKLYKGTPIGNNMRFFALNFFIFALFFLPNLSFANRVCTSQGCFYSSPPFDLPVGSPIASRAANSATANTAGNAGATQALKEAKEHLDKALELESKAQQLESDANCESDEAAANNDRDKAKKKKEEAKKEREISDLYKAQAKANADSAAKNLAQQQALDGCNSHQSGKSGGQPPMMPPQSPQQQQAQKKDSEDDSTAQNPPMFPEFKIKTPKGLNPEEVAAEPSKVYSPYPDFSLPFNGKTKGNPI